MTIQALNIQQQVLHLISQIQCEDIRRMRENRENNRQNISLPVTIKSTDPSLERDAISRDISSAGIGLITTGCFEAETVCELEIQLNSSVTTIFGKCQWCEKYGRDFFLTGWKFVSAPELH